MLEDELDFDDGEGVLLETGGSVLLDGESKQTYNITMEEGTIPFTSLGNLIAEDNSGEILLEGVHNEQVQHGGSRLLLNRYRENNPNSSYLVIEIVTQVTRTIGYPQRSLVIYLFLMEQIQMEQTQEVLSY